MADVRFYKFLIWLNALLPLAIFLWDWRGGRLGANPAEFALRSTGVLTLILVLVSLAITPLRKIFKWNQLIKYRRTLGLFAFFYGLVHLTIYITLDRGGDIAGVVDDVIQRPFIALGMAALLLMVPLTVTSTGGMIKRLGGKRWQMLHRLVYLTAIGGVLHFWMIVKSDVFYPVVFGLILATLFAVRLYYSARLAKIKGVQVN